MQTAFTDGSGTFRIPNLPLGEYDLSAGAEGYLMEQAVTPSSAGGSRSRFHPRETVSFTLRKGGVITGKVTSENDEPVVEVCITAEWHRDSRGQLFPSSRGHDYKWAFTDDRGNYRIYGLPEGSYLIRAGIDSRQPDHISPYKHNIPIYYQSGSRERAVEVPVRLGQEVTGIDIRYKAEHGFSISGIVAQVQDTGVGLSLTGVSLLQSSTQALIGAVSCTKDGRDWRFQFDGVPPGEYDLLAEQMRNGEVDGARADPMHVRVVDSDLKDVVLHLLPFGSTSGKVVIEPSAPDTSKSCNAETPEKLRGSSLWLVPSQLKQWPPGQGFPGASISPEGEFAIRAVPAGRYFLTARLPEDYYLKSVVMLTPAPSNNLVDISRSGFVLKPGERSSGVIATVVRGAASLAGRIVPANEQSELPPGLMAIAVPLGRPAENDPLRFAESLVRGKGDYKLHNLMPGRYRLVVRTSSSSGGNVDIPRIIWDAAERTKLRREAGDSGVEVVVSPCEAAKAPNITFAAPQEK